MRTFGNKTLIENQGLKEISIKTERKDEGSLEELHKHFSDRLCCKCGQRDAPRISKYSRSFSFENLTLNTFRFHICNMLLMNIQKQNC